MCSVAAADWSLSFYSVPVVLAPWLASCETSYNRHRVAHAPQTFQTERDVLLKTYPPEIAVRSLENLTYYFCDKSRVEEVERSIYVIDRTVKMCVRNVSNLKYSAVVGLHINDHRLRKFCARTFPFCILRSKIVRY